MFIGHFAVAFGAKRVAPKVSLGTLILAAQWVDLVWPWLVLFGWERVRVAPGTTKYTPLDFESYPITHSLLGVLLWSGLLGVVYWAARKNRVGAVVLGATVLSHWVLDWITHRPDLPIYPLGPKVGLGLWNSIAGTMVVEGTLFVAGVIIYTRATRALDRWGVFSWWSFVIFLTVVWLANSFGPPPPNSRAVAVAGISMALLVWWGYWLDRHRELREY